MKIKHIALITLTAAFGLINSCVPEDSLIDGLVIQPREMRVTIGISAVNANDLFTITPVEGVVTKFTITGQDANVIIDPSGSNYTEYEEELSTIMLTVDNSKIVSETAPLSFQVKIERDGYITAERKIIIADTGMHSIDIPLMKLDDLPSGVKHNVYDNVGTTSSGGVLEEDIEIGNQNSEIEVSIPKGTVLTDDDGNPINGVISITQTTFDPTDDAALQHMPGENGMFNTVINSNGQEEDIEFESAGFFSMTITNNSGAKASNFTNGSIKVTQYTDPNLKNPETGSTVKEGDTVGVWSFDHHDKQWKYESTATFKKVNGKIAVEANLSHLSHWNFDWWFYWRRCTGTFRMVTDNPNDKSYAVISGYLVSSRTGRYASSFAIGGQLNTDISRWGFNQSQQYDLVITSVDGRFNKPSRMSLGNICSGVHRIVLPTKNQNLKTVTVDVEINCNKTKIKPSYWAYLQENSTGRWRYVYMSKGNVVIPAVRVGDTYTIYAYWDRKWHSYQYKYDGTQTKYNFSFNAPSSACGQ